MSKDTSKRTFKTMLQEGRQTSLRIQGCFGGGEYRLLGL